jgi:hypothetical protein
LKVNALGDTAFSYAYGGKTDENINGIELCRQGGFALSGFAASFDSSNFYRLYLIKTDSNGKSTCHQSGCPFAKSKTRIVVQSVSPAVLSDVSQTSPTHTQVGSGGMISDPCSPLGVAERKQEVKLSVYPNPSTGIFKLAFDNIPAGDYQLRIFNYLGVLVANQVIKTRGLAISEEINTSLPPGLYLLQLDNGKDLFDAKLILSR